MRKDVFAVVVWLIVDDDVSYTVDDETTYQNVLLFKFVGTPKKCVLCDSYYKLCHAL